MKSIMLKEPAATSLSKMTPFDRKGIMIKGPNGTFPSGETFTGFRLPEVWKISGGIKTRLNFAITVDLK